MAYTSINFKTKADLKRALAAGRTITVYQPNGDLTGVDLSNVTGRVYLEGPHYPEPHKWYAQADCENGRIVKVK